MKSIEWNCWLGCSFLLWVMGGASRQCSAKEREQQLQPTKEREWISFISSWAAVDEWAEGEWNNKAERNKEMNGAEGSWRNEMKTAASRMASGMNKEWNDNGMICECSPGCLSFLIKWVMSRRLLSRGLTPFQQFLNCFHFGSLGHSTSLLYRGGRGNLCFVFSLVKE